MKRNLNNNNKHTQSNYSESLNIHLYLPVCSNSLIFTVTTRTTYSAVAVCFREWTFKLSERAVV